MSPSTSIDHSSVTQRREQALEFLLGRIDYERSATVPYGQRHMKLDRMRQLLTRLGNPDAGMPIVHLAGTKGKGSTAAMIAAILRAAGYETGLFSSPHLETIEERFAVNGLPSTGDELATYVERLRPIVRAMDREASMSPTYFELTTALALMHFAERQVDVAMLEVGLGGRLDSTNVCQPTVTVIASISFDHTKQLGNTLEEIAAEKAGIIKPGVPVLCGPMAEAPREVIAQIARQHGCRLLAAGRDFCHHYRAPLHLDQQDAWGRLDYEGCVDDQPLRLSDVPLRLLGGHQAANAAIALATIAELRRQGWLISTSAMHEGLAQLTLPARAEIVSRKPTVVLDVAHNVASAEALVQTLQTSFDCQDRLLVLAATRDKDVAGIVRVLLPHFRRTIVTEYQNNPRAVPTRRLGRLVREQLDRLGRTQDAEQVHERFLPTEAWKLAQQLAGPDQLVCVTGSFFIAAELRGVLRAGAQTPG